MEKWHAWSLLANGGMFPKSIYEIIIALHDIYLIVSSNIYKIHVLPLYVLTDWGRVTHICIRKPNIIGSNNDLSPGRRQNIIWTNDGVLLIWPLGTNFSEIFSKIHTFSFKKMHLKTSSAKWRPFCLGLNVLISTSFILCCSKYYSPHSVKQKGMCNLQIWDKESWTLSLSICSLWQSSCTKI